MFFSSEWHKEKKKKASCSIKCFFNLFFPTSYIWKNYSNFSSPVGMLLFVWLKELHEADCLDCSSPQNLFWLLVCVALVVKLTVMPIPKLCLFLTLISQQALGLHNATPLIYKVSTCSIEYKTLIYSTGKRGEGEKESFVFVFFFSFRLLAVVQLSNFN